MCDCQYPLCTVTADVYLRRRPKRNGRWTIDRHLDCLLCGPRVERTETVEPPPHNVMGSFVAYRFFEPAHWRATRAGLAGLMKQREQGLLRREEER